MVFAGDTLIAEVFPIRDKDKREWFGIDNEIRVKQGMNRELTVEKINTDCPELIEKYKIDKTKWVGIF
jgi:hypothetical protein